MLQLGLALILKNSQTWKLGGRNWRTVLALSWEWMYPKKPWRISRIPRKSRRLLTRPGLGSWAEWTKIGETSGFLFTSRIFSSIWKFVAYAFWIHISWSQTSNQFNLRGSLNKYNSCIEICLNIQCQQHPYCHDYHINCGRLSKLVPFSRGWIVSSRYFHWERATRWVMLEFHLRMNEWVIESDSARWVERLLQLTMPDSYDAIYVSGLMIFIYYITYSCWRHILLYVKKCDRESLIFDYLYNINSWQF